MFDLAKQEIENQIRIINQKLPSIDESIKNYEALLANYRREKSEMLMKKIELEEIIKRLELKEEE